MGFPSTLEEALAGRAIGLLALIWLVAPLQAKLAMRAEADDIVG